MRNSQKRTDKKQTDWLSRNAVQKNIFVWTFMSIAIVNFAIFYLYVNINSFVLAFTDVNGKFGLDYFKSVFELIVQDGGSLGIALKNTSIYFLYGVIVFPLGLIHAYLFYKKLKWGNFFRLVFHLPLIISAVVMTTTFKYMINPDGPLGVLYLKIFNADRVPAFLIEEEYAKWTMIFYNFWFGYAGSLLLWGGAMARIPTEIVESVNMDGIGWSRELRSIIIPLIWPTLSITILTMIAGFFSTDVGVLLLSEGSGNSGNVSYWMFVQIKYYNDYHLASAFGLTLSLIIVPVSLLTRKILGKIWADVEY